MSQVANTALLHLGRGGEKRTKRYLASRLLYFFHSFKGEFIDGMSFQTRAQARSTTFDYIETFYNRTRRHSTLHYLSPLAYEQ
ncbi:MAG TPA: hypothetical protein DEV72_03540 [Ktedonobacter sp.]|nr:hypothetical protein [Ktedonobacter sp.]